MDQNRRWSARRRYYIQPYSLFRTDLIVPFNVFQHVSVSNTDIQSQTDMLQTANSAIKLKRVETKKLPKKGSGHFIKVWKRYVRKKDKSGQNVCTTIVCLLNLTILTKNRICSKFFRCKSAANMKFAKLCNQCKGGDGRICPNSKRGNSTVAT